MDYHVATAVGMVGLFPDDDTTAGSPTVAPPYVLHKKGGLRTVVGITCILSILGSALIILSYFFFRDLRTNARLILVHLSVSDLAVSLANFCGDAVQFEKYFNRTMALDDFITGLTPKYIDDLCKFQAFIAHFFTISSVLWTLMLSAYMYAVTTKLSRLSMKENRVFNLFACVFCYGMALFISVWMICTKRLGYSPYNTSGWCGTIQLNVITKKVDYVNIVLGYDLWIVLTSFFIIATYLSLHLYIRQEKKNHKDFAQLARNIDYKFILIPVTFVLLRMWSFVLNVLVEYIRHKTYPSGLHLTIIYLAGIGDSGQGAANAILFVIFTHNVRKRYISFWCRCFSKKPDKEKQGCLIDNHAKDLSASQESHRIVSASIPSNSMHIGSKELQKGKNVAMTPKSYGTSTSSDSMSDSDYA